MPPTPTQTTFAPSTAIVTTSDSGIVARGLRGLATRTVYDLVDDVATRAQREEPDEG